jgi:hypothetical protein
MKKLLFLVATFSFINNYADQQEQSPDLKKSLSERYQVRSLQEKAKKALLAGDHAKAEEYLTELGHLVLSNSSIEEILQNFNSRDYSALEKNIKAEKALSIPQKQKELMLKLIKMENRISHKLLLEKCATDLLGDDVTRCQTIVNQDFEKKQHIQKILEEKLSK